MCAEFIEKKFPEMLEKYSDLKGKVFLDEGDPSQNSKQAKNVMGKLKCRLFRYSARLSHLNPIENIFNLIGKQINRDAKYKNITNKTYPQFC